MTRCTWKDCPDEGAHRLVDREGKVWARLCDAHQREHAAAFEAAGERDPVEAARAIMRVIVLAQGGAKVAAERMRPAAEAGGTLFEALRRGRAP